MNTETQSTRQLILDVGYQLIVEKGFSNVGLSQLLSRAGVPKGSFYHYFKSKEQFGEALIADYFSQYAARLDTLFCDPSLSGFDKLMTYWHKWIEVNDGLCGSQRCLVVKLSAEVSDLSDAMRQSLLAGANQVISMLETSIRQGIDDGSIQISDAKSTANQLYHMWIGASLMSKLNQSTQPMKQALDTTERLLKGHHPF
ncbi:TetR/AcrR family transcriptional regulator [Enterovibrio nigricans]|uniref:Transcriptional regulator, TetR family n=1 Tax=Enterovibrio nigricans DSM 22720 TaxID=1121868 RepID=A0A1T4V6Z8_9GAMM|nr:TetR/AcrR family transcriptional regulator [Enterovibrio nigricans]PKF50351.1 TetR/AcrR family transcriptional regulator [Enterovibrio nigricans]SKA60723.1 transcriptional regulator, TetR family [Enterovibrio nigricans DSM 22720]